MNEQTNYPGWTDEQWRRVNELVASEAEKARVAARYLPLYGPVDPSVVAVPDYLLGSAPNPAFAPLRAPNRLDVDSSPNTYLATITIQIPLANHEVAEPELQAASVAFRRAAVTIARIEDALIFNGQPAPNIAPPPIFPGGWLTGLPPVFSVNGGASQPGLVPAGAMPNVAPPPRSVAPRVDMILPLPAVTAGGVAIPPMPWPPAIRQAAMAAWSEIIVRLISDTVASLEGNGHAGPFACFLAPDVFEAVHTPSPSMVLPRDRILPFLGGEYLCRSNTIPNGYGIVVAGVPSYETVYGKQQKQSGGGGAVEIVVATDISLRYLQQTPEPKFLFRIWEKIALRVKEWDAVAVLRPPSRHDEPLTVGAPLRPMLPTIRGLAAQIKEAISEKEAEIKKYEDKIVAQNAAKTAKLKHYAAEIKKNAADPQKVQEQSDEQELYLVGHSAVLENLASARRTLKDEKKVLDSQLAVIPDLGD